MIVKKLNNLVNTNGGGFPYLILSQVDNSPAKLFKGFILSFVFFLDVFKAMPVFTVNLYCQLMRRKSKVENPRGDAGVLDFILKPKIVKLIFDKYLYSCKSFASGGSHYVCPDAAPATESTPTLFNLALELIKGFTAIKTKALDSLFCGGRGSISHHAFLATVTLSWKVTPENPHSFTASFTAYLYARRLFGAIQPFIKTRIGTKAGVLFKPGRGNLKGIPASLTNQSWINLFWVGHRNLSCLRLKPVLMWWGKA